MFTERKSFRSLLIVLTLALYACMIQSAAARGGGHGGGGHHSGGHHSGHNHHPYHPSHHHEEHHASHHDHHDDHHHVAHHSHHHENWHHGGWGPGDWGAAGLGYGLGYAYGNWNGYGYGGGDTYVDNSTNVTPASDESAGDDTAGDDDSTAANGGADEGFPTDDWPELGVVTYAGQYGASQGQVVVRVVPGSAAEKAGLVPGDVILTFNGKPVPSADDLDEAFDTANGKFEVLVWDARTGRKSTISGALEPAAAPPANETAAVAPAQQ